MWLIQKQQLILLEHLDDAAAEDTDAKATDDSADDAQADDAAETTADTAELTLNKKYCSNKINCPENLQKFPGRYII